MTRFIKEYAGNKIKRLESNNLMQEDIKRESILKIEKVLNLFFNHYMLTVDEAIRLILEA